MTTNTACTVGAQYVAWRGKVQTFKLLEIWTQLLRAAWISTTNDTKQDQQTSPRDRHKHHVSGGKFTEKKQAQPEFSCGLIALICTPSCWLSVSARWQVWEGSGGITELLPALCAVGRALCGGSLMSTTTRASDFHPPCSWLACLEGQQDMDQPSLGDKNCTSHRRLCKMLRSQHE